MAQIMYIMIIFLRIVSATSTLVTQHFKKNIHLSNKILDYNRAETIRSSSSIKCAEYCDQSCSFIGFNTLTNVCRVFKTCEQYKVVGKEDGWKYYIKTQLAKPTNCQVLHKRGYTTSGIFTIYPWDGDECNKNFRHVEVFCDMETLQGGWTVLQRRISGSVDFNKTWTEYKNGFGNLMESFWIGNDVIHQLTRTETVTLYVAITLDSGETKHQVYQHFSVAAASDKFRLFLQGPTYGSLGDGIVSTGFPKNDLSGMLFTTHDQDNDASVNYNCALYFEGGGWWFNSCHAAYLNGPWRSSRWRYPWSSAVTSGVDVRRTVMMIKPN